MASIALTTQAIRRASCPPDKIRMQYAVVGHTGLFLRVSRAGSKTFYAFYRSGSGRKSQGRWDKIGDADALDLRRVKALWREKLGAVARGEDPLAERKAEAKRARSRFAPALESYEADLARRCVVKRAEYLSLLRRELLSPLGNVELAELDRATLVERIRAIEASGRPGAARELRVRAGVFLGWCVDEGLLTANPLAGWRRIRRTRAERLDRPGRALADWEIPHLWRAASAAGWSFGPYLQMLLLTGQRRTETALMRWQDLDLEGGVWTIPAAVTKSSRAHRVPLPSAAVAVLSALPRITRSDLVFPGHQGRPITGWSKRLPSVYRTTGEAGMAPWTLHDLRRTMRSGLGHLDVDRIIAELLLNHAISNELTAIYDRSEYWAQRQQSAERWGAHVMGLIGSVAHAA